MLRLKALGQQPVIQSLNPGEYTPYISYADPSVNVYTPTPNSPTVPLTNDDKRILADTSAATLVNTASNAAAPPLFARPQQQPSGNILGFSTNQIIAAGMVGLIIYGFSNRS